MLFKYQTKLKIFNWVYMLPWPFYEMKYWKIFDEVWEREDFGY